MVRIIGLMFIIICICTVSTRDVKWLMFMVVVSYNQIVPENTIHRTGQHRDGQPNRDAKNYVKKWLGTAKHLLRKPANREDGMSERMAKAKHLCNTDNLIRKYKRLLLLDSTIKKSDSVTLLLRKILKVWQRQVIDWLTIHYNKGW